MTSPSPTWRSVTSPCRPTCIPRHSDQNTLTCLSAYHQYTAFSHLPTSTVCGSTLNTPSSPANFSPSSTLVSTGKGPSQEPEYWGRGGGDSSVGETESQLERTGLTEIKQTESVRNILLVCPVMLKVTKCCFLAGKICFHLHFSKHRSASGSGSPTGVNSQ